MQRKPHILFLSAIILTALAAGAGCNKLRARDKLNKGVTAYKNAQFDVAIEDFKTARELDPTLTNAQLYLATAYASQYIPGAPSPDNIRNGEQAITEFKKILDEDPNNLAAIDGIGSILYNMGGTPYDEKKLNESKAYHEKHIELSPNDPEPYYWVGVIDWAVAYRGNRDAREEYNKTATAKKRIKENDPMPPAVAKKFADQYGSLVDEGISKIEKAIELQPNYDDAMAYLNLLYRQKADMEASAAAREADLKKADELVDKVKAIKQKKANLQPTS
jgi:tetratricopeptide (TPR) repeat protein